MSVEIDIQGDKSYGRLVLSERQRNRQGGCSCREAGSHSGTTGPERRKSEAFIPEAGDLKAKAQIRADEDGATILVKGAPEAIHKYQGQEAAGRRLRICKTRENDACPPRL